MSTAHHLRPVPEFSHSPSTTVSTISPTDHSPQHKTRSSPRQGRRPLTPSSLRDVNLSQASESLPRNPHYPTPPTGHDLMAMFPPAPPDNIPEMRPGPTSGFFQRQERAFFAQAGKEIVRVCVDVDVGHGSEDSVKSRNSTRPWSSAAGPSGTPSIQPSVQGPTGPYPPPSSRPRVNVSPTMYPAASHSPPSATQNTHPPPHHPGSSGGRTPPHDIMLSGPPNQKPEYVPDDFTDESWRRPMPYAERRRAGKHTRRVLRT